MTRRLAWLLTTLVFVDTVSSQLDLYIKQDLVYFKTFSHKYITKQMWLISPRPVYCRKMPAFLYLQLLSACFWSAALYAKCSNCLQIKRVPNPVKIEEGYLRSVAKTQYSALQKIYTAVFSCNLSHEPADSIKTINTSFCYFFFSTKKPKHLNRICVVVKKDYAVSGSVLFSINRSQFCSAAWLQRAHTCTHTTQMHLSFSLWLFLLSVPPGLTHCFIMSLLYFSPITLSQAIPTQIPVRTEPHRASVMLSVLMQPQPWLMGK